MMPVIDDSIFSLLHLANTLLKHYFVFIKTPERIDIYFHL
jgi:hypothetical protein